LRTSYCLPWGAESSYLTVWKSPTVCCVLPNQKHPVLCSAKFALQTHTRASRDRLSFRRPTVLLLDHTEPPELLERIHVSHNIHATTFVHHIVAIAKYHHWGDTGITHSEGVWRTLGLRRASTLYGSHDYIPVPAQRALYTKRAKRAHGEGAWAYFVWDACIAISPVSRQTTQLGPNGFVDSGVTKIARRDRGRKPYKAVTHK
jgi:hypothetical protein